MPQRFVTPSKITAWLECAHYLGLKHEVEAGLREAPAGGMGSFAELLAEKGTQHEQACLEHYEQQGLRVRRVPEREARESFAAWVTRVGDVLGEDDWDVLYQMPLIHDGIRGIADFLVRSTDDYGLAQIEPVDAKLARKEAKPGHVLQLCFYADAVEASTGRRPQRMHLWLGSGQVETLAVNDFSAYWRRLRKRLAAVLDIDVAPPSAPEPCDHCAFCEFSSVCEEQWRSEDSLVFVAGVRSAERSALTEAGVGTLAGLASAEAPVAGVSAARQPRLVTQAALQLQAREAEKDDPPPFELIEGGDDPAWGHGFEMLPAPDDGDVFLDFEGHPFWRASTGLFFLFGLIEQDGAGAWTYRAWWSHDLAQEGEAARALVEYLVARRQQHPGMHVYHYNHTERSSLERLTRDHGVAQLELAALVDTGAFADLLMVARGAVQVGVESYGLKSLERLTGYQRGHDIDQGAGAVVEYERYMSDGSPEALVRIAAYNEDDVRATRAVRDWLVAQRPADLPWRAAVLEPSDEVPELDEQVAALHAFGPDTPQHLLGDVLGYWRREWFAHLAPLLARCTAETDELLDDPEVLAGLADAMIVERVGAKGQALKPALRLTLPPQDVTGFKGKDQVVFPTPDGPPGYASVIALDEQAGTVDLLWQEEDAPAPPSVVVRNGWVSPNPKPAALTELAAQVLDPTANGAPRPSALALLERRLPDLLPGHEPAGGLFTGDLDEMLRWTTGLDGTCVAVQGPPGTGKTFRGSRQILALLRAGKRVGITAFSHHAIDNLLEGVVDAFREAGELDLLNAVRKVSTLPTAQLPAVTYTTNNKAAGKPEHNLVAGTTWLFAGNHLSDAPVDVLVIDEAGQLSLADALAACRWADNLVMLGDPLQLPQVAQATHPGGSGRSALEHLLGDDATMPAERGVFLSETRRMHPDVCGFISDNVYEGRLTSHPSCAQQQTARGTGLRWLPAQHVERSTHSIEEAELVHDEVLGLLGAEWADQHGVIKPLVVRDVLVVAPYNDQVDLLREVLEGDARTRGVAVGTVDKFQGREAAVVFFTMATSSAADMSRSADFLFSRNRFNVAVSRARCLAYLVCTEALLDSRGRDVEEMRLISTLCAFAEVANQAAALRAVELPRQAGEQRRLSTSPPPR